MRSCETRCIVCHHDTHLYTLALSPADLSVAQTPFDTTCGKSLRLVLLGTLSLPVWLAWEYVFVGLVHLSIHQRALTSTPSIA